MTIRYIDKDSGNRLLLFFAGWGMDETPFLALRRSGYDIAVVFDYTGFDPDASAARIREFIAPYAETVVIAWSFGVRVAQEILSLLNQCPTNITRTVAVNGSPMHVNDSLGIPEIIFNGTLAGLSETSLRKFYRRMFATSGEFAEFESRRPRRPFESLRGELVTFSRLSPLMPDPGIWNLALVSSADRIFPPANLLAAWSGVEMKVLEDSPHCPDFNDLFSRFVVDKRLIADKFSKAAPSYAAQASVQDHAAGRLWCLARPHVFRLADSHAGSRSPLNALEVGFGSGVLTARYVPEIPSLNLTLWDIASLPMPSSAPAAAKMVCCDAESEIKRLPSGSVDLLLSASALQWFHSPARFIAQLARVLSPGGIAAISLFGKGTFAEIERLTGLTLVYPHIRQLVAAAVENGLTPLEEIGETYTKEFPSVKEMLLHLRQTGVNALESDAAHARRAALRLMKTYPLTPSGAARLTYHTLYLLFRR